MRWFGTTGPEPAKRRLSQQSESAHAHSIIHYHDAAIGASTKPIQGTSHVDYHSSREAAAAATVCMPLQDFRDLHLHLHSSRLHLHLC